MPTLLEFRPANQDDALVLARIAARAFGMSERDVDEYGAEVVMARSNPRQYYLGLLDGKPVGKIDVVFNAHEAVIYGFSVLPAYQGRGYGRQMLARTIQEIMAQGQSHIELEVDVENPHALALYQSCGFKNAGRYDYYSLALE